MYTNPLPTAIDPALSTIEQTLIEIWKNALSADGLSIHDNFFDRGGNALTALKVVSATNKLFGRHLTLSTVFDYPTIESLARALANKKNLKTRSLVLLKKGGNKMPLYIVTYLGGSVDRFCDFAYKLDAEQPVYGLQTPRDLEYFKQQGFDMEEVAEGYIQNEASRYVSLLLNQNPNGPFALAGYSYGGFIALEMAKQLRAKGKQIALLAMLDTVVPGNKKIVPVIPEGVALKGLSKINYRQKLLRQEFNTSIYDNIFLLKTDTRKWIRNKIQLVKQLFVGSEERKPKAKPSANSKELTRHRKTLAMVAKNAYPLEYYNGEIFLFRVRKLSSYSVYDFYLGWRPYCKSIKVHKVDGDHIFIFNPYYSKCLAKRLQQELDKRQAKEKSGVFSQANRTKSLQNCKPQSQE